MMLPEPHKDERRRKLSKEDELAIYYLVAGGHPRQKIADFFDIHIGTVASGALSHARWWIEDMKQDWLREHNNGE